ncbi:ABC-three component system protein [Nocardiopsis endophytica]
MSDFAGARPEGAPPELTDLQAPEVPAVTPSLRGPSMTPRQYIFFYSPDEWEHFIREWATALGTDYVQIKRLGGSNDRGADVAGFKTDMQFEGPWDCYQGKHYSEALKPSDAFPEMLKVFTSVIDGHYVLPDCYAFFAPKGCGPTLNRLLSRPTELRNWFLEQLDKGDSLASEIPEDLRDNVARLAKTADFALFRSVELEDALETHRGTPYHVGRFGSPVPPRPGHDSPPDEVGAHETRYVAQLIEVYAEKEPAESFTAENVSSHGKFGGHYRRQRESFYSAEALRLYARDSVPPGTFEALQTDVYSGVIEVAETSHSSGMDRLTSVLTASGQLDLSAHELISVSRIEDRKGICHHLANEDRLTWVKERS